MATVIFLSLLLLSLELCSSDTFTDNFIHEPGKCIIQGSCGNSLPCAVNTADPIVPDTEHQELLHEACPMYADDESVCCDKDQLRDFISQIDIVKNIIGGCEACMYDFKAVECGFFCSSNHSQYVQIKETVVNETTNTESIVGIRYFITPTAAERIYSTCKNVRDSLTGGIGIVYVCGSADCDQATFYEKLGDNSYIDLKVEFIIGEGNFGVDYIEPYDDRDLYDCWEVVNGKVCSCYDCEEKACPVPRKVEPPPQYWKYTLPVGVATSVLLIILITIVTARHTPTSATSKETIEIQPVKGMENRGIDVSSPIPTRINGVGMNNGATSPDPDRIHTPDLAPRPRDLPPMSPQLSVASTVSPMPGVISDGKKYQRLCQEGPKVEPLYDQEIVNFKEGQEYTTVPCPEPGSHSRNTSDGLDHDENRSLIRREELWYQFWLRMGPTMGERWANLIYDFPLVVVLICLVVSAACCGGWYNFSLTTDPIELWTAEESMSRVHAKEYKSMFGTTYRTCQLVVKQRSKSTFGVGNQIVDGVFHPDVLKQVYDMMVDVQSLEVEGATYSDICYKPLGEFNSTHPMQDCATISLFQWLKNDRSNLEDPEFYISRLALCAEANVLPECMASFRGPASTNTALGGYNADKNDYMKSTTLMVTFALDGAPKNRDYILLWETAMKEYLLEQIQERPDLFIAFSTDRALADEIDRASHADIFTIILSYVLMFVYVGVTLGDIHLSCSGCLLNSKALLGVGGVVIVLISVVSALGVTSYAGLPTTLIVVEVIPFLILAVGVDNVYIMVQGVQRVIEDRIEREEPLSKGSVRGVISNMMRTVFPAMILSSFCQMVAFALGSLSFMPSVQNFAYNATIALLLNFLLQSTMFLILLRIDLTRQLSGRLDIFCCLKTKMSKAERAPTRWFIEDYYSKWLFLSKWIPAVILMFFGCFTIANIMLIPDLNLGLEPTMALPADSYLLDYYDTVFKDYRMSVGFNLIIKSKDGQPMDIYDKDVYGELLTNDNSIKSIIAKYGADDDYQYIKGSGWSFMNTFNDSWLQGNQCCWNNGDEFCPSTGDRDGCDQCPLDVDKDTIYEYLQWYISDIPRTDGSGCTKGGAVSASNIANFSPDKRSVIATRFSASHGPLKKSNEFIVARQQAMVLAKAINAEQSLVEVYAYNGFYAFYEQYDTIVKELIMNLVLCIAATFVVALVLLGFQLQAALVVLLSVTMCAVDMVGSMVYLDIPLNAISLVNLLLAVGIAVEFSANIVQAYTLSPEKGRLARAQDALRRTGPAIVSGIAMTNFVGVVVLAAAKSQLFVVFYFRMFFTINCLCVAHTMLFLPAFLGFLGD